MDISEPSIWSNNSILSSMVQPVVDHDAMVRPYRGADVPVARKATQTGTDKLPKGIVVHSALQPIVGRDGTVRGYEMLARPQKIDGTPVNVGRFIKKVEDAGSEATFRFDSIMFHHTCQLVAESLGTRKPLRIGFNVSGLTVCNPEWSRHVDKTLQRHPELTPYLGFEITETQSLNNFLVAERFCRTMRDAGSQVILDDCDAYAAPYLKRMIDAFGPGKIKVSRDGFVDHCKQPENSALRSICYLARAHNVPVVIEGIENRNQFDSVRDFNSVNQFFQGYMFGKPKIYPIPSVLPEADVAVHAPARTVIRARVHAHH